MPWNIRREGNQWCVYKTDTGEKEGCSDSKEKAISHKRVLYGRERGWKPTGKPRQK